MKHLKFSRLFAAFAFVAILALAGCKQPEERSVAVEGTWVSSWGEKNVITTESVKNYMDGQNLFYEMSIDEIKEITNTSGILYGILTTGTQYTPEGEYYAVVYKDLDAQSVRLSATPASFKTLDEVKASYADLDAFEYWSDCTKVEE